MIPAELWEFASGPFGWAFAFGLGWLFGSFANVGIYRWPPTEEFPRGRSVVKPASHCFGCGAAVRAIDNIPILSYLLLRGRCRVCKIGFSARYMMIEAMTGLLFAATFYFCVVLFPDVAPADRLLRFAIYAAFMFVMVVITFIDLDHKLILDKITYPSIPFFYGAGLLLPENQWWDGLVGAAVGYAVVRLIADGYYLFTKREGMGYGDGKLLAIFGALWGWKAVFAGLFLGSIVGTIVCVPLLLLGGRAKTDADRGEGEEETSAEEDVLEDPPGMGRVEVPFGPFLITGAIVYMYLSPWIEVTVRRSFFW